MGDLVRYQNGYMFSVRRYRTVCPYCHIETVTKKKQETGSTEEEIEKMLFAQDLTPVCRRIMCISGARQGKDHKIKSDRNFIRRADDMDIQILGDSKTFKRNHSVIVFDPEKEETVIPPGDSSGIVYLSGNAIYTSIVLESYDVIEIGDSKLVFVPFCSESFMWEDDGGKS